MRIQLKSSHYQLINDILFHNNYERVLLRCLETNDTKINLKELHDGLVGGHYGGDTMSYKILQVGYH